MIEAAQAFLAANWFMPEFLLWGVLERAVAH